MLDNTIEPWFTIATYTVKNDNLGRV